MSGAARSTATRRPTLADDGVTLPEPSSPCREQHFPLGSEGEIMARLVAADGSEHLLGIRTNDARAADAIRRRLGPALAETPFRFPNIEVRFGSRRGGIDRREPRVPTGHRGGAHVLPGTGDRRRAGPIAHVPCSPDGHRTTARARAGAGGLGGARLRHVLHGGRCPASPVGGGGLFTVAAHAGAGRRGHERRVAAPRVRRLGARVYAAADHPPGGPRGRTPPRSSASACRHAQQAPDRRAAPTTPGREPARPRPCRGGRTDRSHRLVGFP